MPSTIDLTRLNRSLWADGVSYVRDHTLVRAHAANVLLRDTHLKQQGQARTGKDLKS